MNHTGGIRTDLLETTVPAPEDIEGLLGPLTRRELLRSGIASGLALSSGVVFLGCSRDDASTSGKTRKVKRSVTFVSDVAPYGKHAPFYVATEQGWARRGLSVSIEAGNGSADAITKVAGGAGQFALADTSAVVVARGNRGLPVRLVSMYHYKNLMAELTLEHTGIRRPQDLEGSSQQTTAGDATLILLPVLGSLNGFDASKVNVSIADFTSHVPNILSQRVQGALTYYTLFPALEAAARQRGMRASAFLYADFGLDLYNNGIVTTDDVIKGDPDLVRDFVAGFTEAVVFSVEHPAEAVTIFRGHVPGFDEAIARAQLDVAVEHTKVDEVRTVGFGPMDPLKMAHTVDLVNANFTLSNRVQLSDVYTNDFASLGQRPRF